MKQSPVTRFLILALVFLMIGLTACSGGGDKPAATKAPEGGGNSSPEATTEAETTVPVATLLGFEKEDNKGETFTIMDTSLASYQYDAESLTGEVVNDAVYDKNRTVEDYLGIKLKVQIVTGGWNQRNDFNGVIKNAVTAGDDTIDLISSAVVITLPIATDGVFIEGKKLGYLDLDHAWWIPEQYERFSIADKLYGFFGDASLSVYKDLNVIFFNKKIWNDNKMGNPYDWVRSNKWTFDKFIEVGSAMALDLNGDGAYDYDNDQISFIGEHVPNGTMQQSLDLHVVEIQKDRTIKFLGLTDKFAECYEKYGNFMNQAGIGTLSSIDDLSYKSQKYFANGNVATMANFLYSTEHLRDMEDDYGILPMPKYDESQEKYLTRLGTSTTMLYVPKTQSNTDLVSKAMEAFCYYTRELVVPKYYESALKEKYARDEDVAEMLDIIRAGAMMDFESVWSTAFSPNMSTYFRFTGTALAQGSFTNTLASSFASNGEKLMAAIEKAAESFKSLED